MGVKELNQYLLKHCTDNAIKKTHFIHLKRKTVVVDISIYLYKFMADDNFMESLYTFLSLFKYYIITPIFIFDGKPPPEKWAALKKRRWEKKDAAIRFNEIQESLETHTVELDEDLKKEMDELKRKMIKIEKSDFIKVKELMDAFGYLYYEAPGEADVLCAYLVKSGKAWACLSDDMDMFLYGCPRVLRNLSLMKHRFILYDTNIILQELGITSEQFLKIVILSGTDYNEGSISLRKLFELHNEYLSIDSSDINKLEFSEWVLQTQNIQQTIQNIAEIEGYFNINENSKISVLEEVNNNSERDILEKQVSIPRIKEIMVEYGFIFV